MHESEVAALCIYRPPRFRGFESSNALRHEVHNIASCTLVAAKALAEAGSSEAIPLRDVKIGVKKIEWMNVKNPNRGWGRLRI